MMFEKAEKKKEKIFDLILNHPEKTEVYAVTGFKLYYKAYLITPKGTLKLDTSDSQWVLTRHARKLIEQNKLTKISLIELITNYEQNDLFEKRIYEKRLIEWKNKGQGRIPFFEHPAQ